ncbi:hypothetical protein ACQP2X_39740 [Actinoplanes sp. CA-131856]
MAALPFAWAAATWFIYQARDYHETYLGRTYLVYAIVLAIPPLISNRTIFRVVTLALVPLIFIAGVAQLDISLWPTILPLLLAQIRIPDERRKTMGLLSLISTACVLGLLAVFITGEIIAEYRTYGPS